MLHHHHFSYVSNWQLKRPDEVWLSAHQATFLGPLNGAQIETFRERKKLLEIWKFKNLKIQKPSQANNSNLLLFAWPVNHTHTLKVPLDFRWLAC